MSTNDSERLSESAPRPPRSDRMAQHMVVTALHDQSTLRLVMLTLFTLGIYDAHYLRRQSRRIRELTGSKKSIPAFFVNGVLVLNYITVAMLIPCIFVPDSHPIQEATETLDTVILIAMTVWSFAARHQLHYLLGATIRGHYWFNAFWTLVFGPFYINYRINKLYDEVEFLNSQTV